MNTELENLHLISFENPSLFQPLPQFDFENPPVDPVQLKDALMAAMFKFGGAGLSANQVGLPYKVFVYGTTTLHGVCFNPQIVGVSKNVVLMKEGCLSLPGVWLMINRPSSIVITYQNEKGEQISQEVTGWSARIMQHEYDHMLGRNFTMLASKLKIDRAMKAALKKIKAGQPVTTEILK